MMSAIPKVVHRKRATITALPLYYSGPLLKKHKKEKDFKKYHGELRGTILFLYKDETQDTYTEKLDLEELKFMKLGSPYQRKMSTIFSLTLGTEEVQLKMDNPNTGEVWRGYILTVINKEIPSKLQLLPGQLLQLQEVLAQERKRNQPLPHPPLPPRPSFLTSASPAPAPSSSSSPSPPPPPINKPDGVSELPACFFNVTRQEAEQMLEANPEYGDMILRPSTLANNYALTLRQVTPRGPVMKNYRVTSTNSGFIIELDTAVRVSSLNDVLQYFLEKTEHRLHPFVTSQPYDTRIEVSPAPEYTFTPTPKTVPKAQVAPMLRSNTNKGLQPPTKPVDGEYVVPDDQSLELDQDLDGELREVLKLRRETIYSTTDEEVTHYKNQMSDKS